MYKSFLVYWLQKQIQQGLVDRVLDHSASGQFSRVAPGDVLWICGGTATNRLVTLGPIRVAEIVGQREAARRLRYKPWPARWHVLCARDEEAVAREVSLEVILPELEFESSQRRYLDLSKPIGRQLQTMRQLTEKSAQRISALWNGASVRAQSAHDRIQADLNAYDKLDAERLALVRREQAFIRKHLFREHPTGDCAICGETLPVELLVAAHIKPRSECTEEERRDFVNNVVPMCLLGCDALFERRWIAVIDGTIVVRPHTRTGRRLGVLLRRIDGRKTIAWRNNRIKYFEWHARLRPMGDEIIE